MENSEVLVGLHNDEQFCLRLEGDIRVPWCISLESYCETLIQQPKVTEVCVDLTGADNLDSTTLGVLAKVAILTQKHCNKKATLLCDDDDIQRLILSMGFAQVFDIQRGSLVEDIVLEALPIIDHTELSAQDSVIDAHRSLMDMNEKNRTIFVDLVETLEKNKAEVKIK